MKWVKAFMKGCEMKIKMKHQTFCLIGFYVKVTYGSIVLC